MEKPGTGFNIFRCSRIVGLFLSGQLSCLIHPADDFLALGGTVKVVLGYFGFVFNKARNPGQFKIAIGNASVIGQEGLIQAMPSFQQRGAPFRPAFNGAEHAFQIGHLRGIKHIGKILRSSPAGRHIHRVDKLILIINGQARRLAHRQVGCFLFHGHPAVHLRPRIVGQVKSLGSKSPHVPARIGSGRDRLRRQRCEFGIGGWADFRGHHPLQIFLCPQFVHHRYPAVLVQVYVEKATIGFPVDAEKCLPGGGLYKKSCLSDTE